MRYAIARRLAGGMVLAAALGAFGVPGPSGPALAGPGDVHEVRPDRANLRAGPSEQDNIRTTLAQGEQVIEIRRERDWVGIRSFRTGAEGWIHADLLEAVSPSALGQTGGIAPAETPETDMGFRQYSRGFDAMLAGASRRMGIGPMFEDVTRTQDGVMALTPTEGFLRDAGRDAHMLAALAVHQMLKNHQGGEPVAVTLLGPGGSDYVSVDDRSGTAELTVQAAGEAAQQAAR
jgi:hypothetical protein